MLSLIGSLIVAERKGDTDLVSEKYIMESLDDHCTIQNQQSYYGKKTNMGVWHMEKSFGFWVIS